MKKKICSVAFALLLLTAASQQRAFAALPEIDGWDCSELRATKLDTVSGNKGTWEERSYRTPGGERYHAVWIEGAGEKSWQPVAASQDEKNELLESGAVYKNVEVLGQKAVFEEEPLVGKSLTVKIAKKGTLTLETGNADKTALLDAAAILTRDLLQ